MTPSPTPGVPELLAELDRLYEAIEVAGSPSIENGAIEEFGERAIESYPELRAALLAPPASQGQGEGDAIKSAQAGDLRPLLRRLRELERELAECQAANRGLLERASAAESELARLRESEAKLLHLSKLATPAEFTLQENARLRAEAERGYQMLEANGVSRERAKSLGNGIDVLVTRMVKEIASLRAEADAGREDKKDAARYRWLQKHETGWGYQTHGGAMWVSGEALNAAIDAARAAGRHGGERG